MNTDFNSGGTGGGNMSLPAPENHMLMGILAYLGPLVIVSYFVAKDNSFVKFHIKQGLVLLSIELAVWVLGMIMWPLFPFLRLIDLAVLVLAIVGIVRVTQKKEIPLPIVGQYARYFSI